jgi:hypothetical protein
VTASEEALAAAASAEDLDEALAEDSDEALVEDLEADAALVVAEAAERSNLPIYDFFFGKNKNKKMI